MGISFSTSSMSFLFMCYPFFLSFLSSFCSQGKDLLTQKIPVWQQACSDPNKLPERAMLLAQQMGSAALGGTSPLHTSKSNLVISDPIPGAQPLPVPPELAVFMGSGLGHPAVSFIKGDGWRKNSTFWFIYRIYMLVSYMKKKKTWHR